MAWEVSSLRARDQTEKQKTKERLRPCPLRVFLARRNDPRWVPSAESIGSLFHLRRYHCRSHGHRTFGVQHQTPTSGRTPRLQVPVLVEDEHHVASHLQRPHPPVDRTAGAPVNRASRDGKTTGGRTSEKHTEQTNKTKQTEIHLIRFMKMFIDAKGPCNSTG